MKDQLGNSEMQIGLQTSDHSHVTVNEHVPSDRFNRYVDDRVQEWLKTHELTGESSDYEVAFFDEEALGEVSCLIVVRANDHIWRSWESADNPRRALGRSLERLHQDLQDTSNAEAQSDDDRLTH